MEPGSWRWGLALTPLVVTILQKSLITTGLSKDTEHHDALHRPYVGIPFIHMTIFVLAVVPYVFPFPRTPIPSNAFSTINHSSLIWIVLLYIDLYSAGMLDRIHLPLIAVVLYLLPNPVGMGILWLGREYVLVVRKHKHAMTAERYAEKSIDDVRLGKNECVSGAASGAEGDD